MVFTISITMTGSTMVAPVAVSGTAAFMEAGGERQALLKCRAVDRANGALQPASDFVRALK
jgi:hypothetical protein